MLYPVAGSRFYIADAPISSWADAAAPAPAWVEIGGIEAFGLLGVEWEVVTADVMNGCGPDSRPGELAVKGVERRPEIPMIFGNDPNDPGQVLLWAASRSQGSFPFRIVFPDGATARSWYALVIRIGEVFDTANSVIRLQADLKPTSTIFREDG